MKTADHYAPCIAFALHASSPRGANRAADALNLPLLQQATAGFENPALDFAVKTLDVNDLLILHPRSTFYSLVQGHCMAASGVLDGDVIVVDSALPIRHGDVVLADFDGLLTVKHYSTQAEQISLLPADESYPPLIPKDGQQVRVLGKVTASITLFSPLLSKLRNKGF